MGLVQVRAGSVGRFGFSLSVVVVMTSLVDLLVNRLLFRSGPETLSHLYVPGLPELAAAGRISFTFEQAAVFLILGGAAYVVLRENRAGATRAALLIWPQLATAALLYLPLQPEVSWALNVSLLSVSALLIMWLLASRVRSKARGYEKVFLVSLATTFGFVFYYRAGLLVGSASIASMPLQVEAYTAGVVMAMATCVGAFVYALSIRTPGLGDGVKFHAKLLILPTLAVMPFLYGLTQSYFMTQIFSMVVAMSTDIVLSFNMVRMAFLSSWFLLSAVVLLVAKGRRVHSSSLIQQGMGLILILSASFLFNYANYVLLDTAGVLLITLPLVNGQTE